MSSVPVIPQARGLRHTGPVTVAVVSGPTAVGKGTVVGALLRSHPEIVVSRSVTTRPPRPTERDGIDYDFITPEQFDKLVDGEGLLEWATVHNSHRYGTPRGPVERAVADNRTVVLEIDLQGARQVRETYPQATQIFLAPPSWEELVHRLVGRGTETPEQQKQRLETAKVELANADEFDAVVVNDTVGVPMNSVPVIPQARGLRHTGPVTVAVVSGPTAVGKGTVVGALLRSHPEIVVSRSVTTRPPRPTERDGIDYDFITPEQFDKLVDGEGLLEWATVHNSHRYGTPRGPVERAVADNRTVVLEIDLQGARQVRETYPQATQIFLAPPSWEELVHRLIGRGTETPEQQKQRLETAKVELANADEFDAVVVNDTVDHAVAHLVELLSL